MPDVAPGTANVQLNAPVALAKSEPELQLEIVTPSNTREAIAVETENPEPCTLTVAPTGPWPGLTEIAGTVTVNAPEAVEPPASVATTEVPEVPLGTARVQLNAPEAPVVSDPAVQLVTLTLSKTSEASGVETEKPEPETVTVAPIGPWPGETRSVGTVTVKLPVAVWPPESVATTDVPEVPLGTASVHEKVPLALVASDPAVQLEMPTPSKTSDASVEETENPVPATVTLAPTGP